ncbi:MAG: toll/interleukin-1 receptor domain-containing protein [Gammaproteobacteria bacterium]|jgi:hypothetical protein|nr:toll/interleukin-1 receptor domain-containing protein [Gammaproteobacteria bacterium]
MPENAAASQDMPRRIFVSYSGSDRTRVTGLGLLIEALGHQVFLDHKTIKPGAVWKAELQAGLVHADVLVVFWTKRAADSDWVRKEYEYFHVHFPDRLLVPVLGDETPLSELLKARQHSDFAPLINELLELKRRLTRDGVDAKGVQQAILKRLAEAGIELDEAGRKKLFGFVGVGAISGFAVFTAALGLLRWAGSTATEAVAQLSGAQVALVAAGVISGGVVCGVTDQLINRGYNGNSISLGKWDTTEGTMRIVSTSGKVATYDKDNGRIVGKIQGQSLTGYWVEDGSDEACSSQKDGSKYWGRLKLNFDENFTTFEGTWGYCDKESSRSWTGKRIPTNAEEQVRICIYGDVSSSVDSCGRDADDCKKNCYDHTHTFTTTINGEEVSWEGKTRVYGCRAWYHYNLYECCSVSCSDLRTDKALKCKGVTIPPKIVAASRPFCKEES